MTRAAKLTAMTVTWKILTEGTAVTVQMKDQRGIPDH